MKALRVASSLSLPLDAVTSTLVVYGGKGMGKTNFASVLVEEIDANGLRFAFIDPVGVSWGLRHSVDGKGRGIEILILGGIHGDIPIEPTGGGVVADLVVDEEVNVLIDISRRPDGSMWSIGQRIRFVTDYSKRLYQRQGEKRRPIMQIYDEAARFAPQVIRKNEDDIASCMGAIAVLVEEGRNVGIGVTLLTLRSARLNKDVAELADCMIAFRTVGPNSRAAVMDWLGEHVEKERLRELDTTVRSLPIGSALVVSPGWLRFEGVVAMRARRTFDSSKTPKPGETVRASGPGAKPDLPKYQQRMAETIERSKENDPKELKKQIADLKRQLAAKSPSMPFVDQKAIDRAVREATRDRDTQIRDLPKRLARISALAEQIIATAKRTGLAGAIATVVDEVARRPAPQVARAVERSHRIVNVTADERNGDLGKGERAILAVLAQYPHGKNRRALGTLSGYSSSGGSFGTYLSRLRGKGYIDGSDVIRITDAGAEALGDFEPMPLGEELQHYWLDRLGKGEAAILSVLLEHYPATLERDELGRLAGYDACGGSFGTYLSRLRTKELVDERELRASEAFFE